MDPTKPTNQNPTGIPQPEAGSVGSLQKEGQPFTSESIRPSETEPQIHEELQRLGVEATKAEPPLTEEHEAVGIRPAGESVPVLTQPSGIVQLPMAKEEALQTIKIHQKIGDSIRWLAKLILKQFRKQELREASDTI